MKKIFLIALMVVLPALPQNRRTFSKLFTAPGTTSALNTVVAPSYDAATMHTIAVMVIGSPSLCTYELEGSTDGTNWTSLSGSLTCVTGYNMTHIPYKAVTYVRGNLTGFTGGTSATVSYQGA